MSGGHSAPRLVADAFRQSLPQGSGKQRHPKLQCGSTPSAGALCLGQARGRSPAESPNPSCWASRYPLMRCAKTLDERNRTPRASRRIPRTGPARAIRDRHRWAGGMISRSPAGAAGEWHGAPGSRPESQFRSRWPARISSGKSPPGERQRNVAGAHLKWMFTTEKARTKMGCAYPRTDATLDQPAGDGVDLRAPTPFREHLLRKPDGGV